MNNTIERTWRRYGLTFVEDLRGTGFTAENGAHTFIISGADTDNNPITLSGTVAASFIRPDGTTTAMTGSISAGKAQVTLSAECYGVAGRGTLTIFLTSGGQKVAIYSAVLNIVRSNTKQVSPGVTSDVVDLVNRIDTATASIPSTYTNLLASLAPDYSSSATYKTGDYVWYNGYLYKAKQDISTAESWTAAHWTRVVMSADLTSQIANVNTNLTSEITDLKSAFALFQENIPGTVQTIAFDSARNIQSVTHRENNVVVRTDVFTFAASTITEVRTLASGESLTIVTNTETLETTTTYAAA